MSAKRSSISLSTGIALFTLCTSLAYLAHDFKLAAAHNVKHADLDRFIERLRFAAKWQATEPEAPLIVPGWRTIPLQHGQHEPQD